DFTTLGGQPRSHLGMVGYPSGVATSWNPGADSTVWSLAASGTTLYAGGDFHNAGGQPRARVASLDLGSGSALPWNPGADGSVFALATDGANVYAGGSFLTLAGHIAPRFAAISATTGSQLPWGAFVDNVVGRLALAHSHVYLRRGLGADAAAAVSDPRAVFHPALLAVGPPPETSGTRLAIGPSPLRGSGHVQFVLDHEASVSLRIFDVSGRVARTLLAGEHRAAGPQRVAIE